MRSWERNEKLSFIEDASIHYIFRFTIKRILFYFKVFVYTVFLSSFVFICVVILEQCSRAVAFVNEVCLICAFETVTIPNIFISTTVATSLARSNNSHTFQSANFIVRDANFFAVDVCFVNMFLFFHYRWNLVLLFSNWKVIVYRFKIKEINRNWFGQFDTLKYHTGKLNSKEGKREQYRLLCTFAVHIWDHNPITLQNPLWNS